MITSIKESTLTYWSEKGVFRMPALTLSRKLERKGEQSSATVPADCFKNNPKTADVKIYE